MRVLILFLVLISQAEGAEKKTKLSDTELQALARDELHSATPKGEAPVPLVSTAEFLEEESPERFASSEFELGAQAYKPVGTGRVSATETYSLNRLSPGPMPLIGFRHWFYNGGMNEPGPWRYGASLSAGIASHTLKVRTQSGAVFDDVRLSTVVADLGPEAEYLVGSSLFLGGRAAVGRIFTVQSTNAPILNRSLEEGLWSLAGHLRYQPSRNFFAKLGFAYRAILGTSEGLGTQESNVLALIGFGM